MLFIITTKVFAQQARGPRERFFVLRYYYYVNVITLTLRFRLRYVNVAGVKRIAARVLRTLAVTSQCRIYIRRPRGPRTGTGRKKNPDFPTHVDGSNKTTKNFAQQARGSRDFFVAYFRNVT